MIKVSIIIPVYNVAPYLKKALNSVMHQTLKEIEIICINDCSTDNSLEILKEYAKIDTRFNLIDLKENSGAAVARNKGLEVAKGEFLGFVDPDDYIDLNFYEELYKKALEDGVDIVKCPRKVVGLNNIETIGINHQYLKEHGHKEFFTSEWTTAIYKSSLIFDNNIKFPKQCRKSQDSVFLARCVYRANKLSLINHVFYHYIRRENSLNSIRLTLDALKSAVVAHTLIIEEINISDLDKKNIKLYGELYYENMKAFPLISFRNESREAKEICAFAFIKSYDDCKIKSVLDKHFSKKIIQLLKTKQKEQLIQKLLEAKNPAELLEHTSLLQSIFSIRNYYIDNKSYKVVTIFGFKIRVQKSNSK